MVAFPRLAEPLTDGVVALRPSSARDIPDILVAYEEDPELHVRFGEARPPSAAELGRHREQAEIERQAGRRLTLGILEAGSDVCRGELNVHHVVAAHARGEIGLWLAAGVRGRGLGARALRLGSDWLLERCGFERLSIFTEPDNLPMRAAAERAGFQFEGVLRGYTLERGRRADSALFARVVGRS